MRSGAVKKKGAYEEWCMRSVTLKQLRKKRLREEGAKQLIGGGICVATFFRASH